MFDRKIVIGDLHGCLKSLIKLLRLVQLTDNDQLIFAGDYVDRGPNVPELVEYLINMKSKHPQTVFLMGNHEDLFLRYLSDKCSLDDYRTFRYNGGIETIAQYCKYVGLDNISDIEWDQLPETHKYFFQNLQNIYVDNDDKFIVVHAGLRPNVRIEDQSIDDMLWIREFFLNSDYQWDDYKLIHGHTYMSIDKAKKYHERIPHRFNVDNGCVYGMYLTCVDILSNKTYTVKSELAKERLLYV